MCTGLFPIVVMAKWDTWSEWRMEGGSLPGNESCLFSRFPSSREPSHQYSKKLYIALHNTAIMHYIMAEN